MARRTAESCAEPNPRLSGRRSTGRVQPQAQARILDLIGEVYDAALDERLWPGLAPKIAGTFDSPSAQFHVRHLPENRVERVSLTDNYNSIVFDTYESYYASRDIWVERAVALGTKGIVASKDLVSDAEFAESEVYRDFARPLGVFYVVGAVFPISDNQLVAFGIHRPRDAACYDEQDKTIVGKFLPHLKRALQIRHRLADPAIEHAAALDALERSGTATLVVGADGCLLYANRQAENLLRAGDAILIARNRLAARDRGAAAQLGAFIRDCAMTAGGNGHGSGGALAIARGERLPLSALVAPFRPARDGLGAKLPAAIIFLRDPERSNPRSLALQGLFGLTAAEAAFASGLADGKGVESLAGQLGISLNTAKTHLRNIFAKTSTNRQAQLVALILGSIAMLMGG